MNILCITLLLNDKVHATPADFGLTFKPIPVIDISFFFISVFQVNNLSFNVNNWVIEKITKPLGVYCVITHNHRFFSTE